MLVLSTAESQLLLHKCNVTKAAPEAQEWQETGGLAMVRNCAATLCRLSEFHDPVDSQSQLECISSPVGMPMYMYSDSVV